MSQTLGSTIEVTHSCTALSGNARQTMRGLSEALVEPLAKQPSFPCEKDLLAYIHNFSEAIHELLRQLRYPLRPIEKPRKIPIYDSDRSLMIQRLIWRKSLVSCLIDIRKTVKWDIGHLLNCTIW